MRHLKLTELSNNSEQWYVFYMSDRDCHASVHRMIDDNADYNTVMKVMAKLFRGNAYQVNNRPPHSILTYVHMAESMDRLDEVNPSLIEWCKQRKFISRVKEPEPTKPSTNPKQPKQEIPMEFNTVHYINGTAIPDITDEQLIKYIRDEKKAKESLVALGVDSSAIGLKIAEHGRNIKSLVSILDTRAATTTQA